MSKAMNGLKALNETELGSRMNDMKKELIKLNAQVATGTIPKKPAQIKSIRKNIARILFITRQREIENMIASSARPKEKISGSKAESQKLQKKQKSKREDKK